jgi:hypothetical protein
MFTTNLLVVMSSAFKSSTAKCKLCLLRYRHNSAIEKKKKGDLKKQKPGLIAVKVKPSFNLPKGVAVDGPIPSEREDIEIRIGILKVRGTDPVKLKQLED